jgi:hypothetical protein
MKDNAYTLADTFELAKERWLNFIAWEKGYKQRLAAKPCGKLAAAIRRFQSGNSLPLAEFVRSDPLEREERAQLAEFLQGLNDKRGGHPVDRLIYKAADEVQTFLHFWREENKRHGVSEHRKNDAMAKAAIPVVVAALKVPNSKTDKIYNLWKRRQRAAYQNQKLTRHTDPPLWD